MDKAHESLAMTPATERPYYIPDEDLDPADPFYELFLSKPHLPRSCYRSNHTKCWYNPWELERRADNPYNGLEFLLRQTGSGRRREQSSVGVVIIEEIENEAISNLKKQFPDLDLEFILEHVIRIVTPKSLAPKGTRAVQSFDGEGESYDDKSVTTYGSHFDGPVSPLTADDIPEGAVPSNGMAKGALTYMIASHSKYRLEAFDSDGSGWLRTSTRISCCALKPNLCEYVQNRGMFATDIVQILYSSTDR